MTTSKASTITKLVEYSYPSSTNAVKLGFARSGCWSVEIRSNILDRAKAIKGFETLEAAKAYADTLPHPWDVYSK